MDSKRVTQTQHGAELSWWLLAQNIVFVMALPNACLQTFWLSFRTTVKRSCSLSALLSGAKVPHPAKYKSRSGVMFNCSGGKWAITFHSSRGMSDFSTMTAISLLYVSGLKWLWWWMADAAINAPPDLWLVDLARTRRFFGSTLWTQVAAVRTSLGWMVLPAHTCWLKTFTDTKYGNRSMVVGRPFIIFSGGLAVPAKQTNNGYFFLLTFTDTRVDSPVVDLDSNYRKLCKLAIATTTQIVTFSQTLWLSYWRDYFPLLEIGRSILELIFIQNQDVWYLEVI